MSAQSPAPRLSDLGWDRGPATVPAPGAAGRDSRRSRAGWRRSPLATMAAALTPPVVGLAVLGAVGALSGVGGPGLSSLPGVDGLGGADPGAVAQDRPERTHERRDGDRGRRRSRAKAGAARTPTPTEPGRKPPSTGGQKLRPTPPGPIAHTEPVQPPPPTEEEGDLGEEGQPPPASDDDFGSSGPSGGYETGGSNRGYDPDS